MSIGEKKVSLVEFAVNRPRRGKPCWVCNLPQEILEELNGARESGIGLTVMYEWLRDVKGYPEATVPRMDNHYNRGHHQPSNS